MTIKISSSAITDLQEGWRFYEKQGAGLGDYFEDTLLSDIESLLLYAGIHRQFFGYYRLLSKRLFAIYYMEKSSRFGEFLILDKILQKLPTG